MYWNPQRLSLPHAISRAVSARESDEEVWASVAEDHAVADGAGAVAVALPGGDEHRQGEAGITCRPSHEPVCTCRAVANENERRLDAQHDVAHPAVVGIVASAGEGDAETRRGQNPLVCQRPPPGHATTSGGGGTVREGEDAGATSRGAEASA